MKKTEKKPREESELSKKIRQHMHDTRKKLGGIDHMLDQMKKPLGEKALEREGDTPEAKRYRKLVKKKLEEAVEHKVGSLIRHGIETSKKSRGRAVIISRNDKIASIEGDTVKTAKGVELKASQKVGSRSNIEKHGDWNVIREEAIDEVSNKTLRSFADKAKGDEKRSDGIRRALHKLVKDPSVKVPGTKSKWEFKEDSSFGSAFAAARTAGKEVFDFGGKSFTTRKAGESDSKWKGSLKPAVAPVPAPRLDRAKLRPANAGPSGNPANDAKPKEVSKPMKPNAGPSGNPANNPKPAVSGLRMPKPMKPNAGPSGNPANEPKPLSARQKQTNTLAATYVTNPMKHSTNGGKAGNADGVNNAMSAVKKAADRARLKTTMDKKFKTEEVLGELSSSIVGRYSRKANDSLAHILPKVLAGDKAAAKKELSREKGIDTADRKLRKHSSAKVYATEENQVTTEAEKSKEKDHMVNCPSCKGHGKKMDRYDNYDICDDCDGKGKVTAKSLAEKAEQDGVYKAKTAATKKFNNMTGHEHKGVTYWNSGDKKSPLSGKHPGKPANGRYKLRVVEQIIAKRMAELEETSAAKAQRYIDAARDEHSAIQKMLRTTSDPQSAKELRHKGKMRVRGVMRAQGKIKEDVEQVELSEIGNTERGQMRLRSYMRGAAKAFVKHDDRSDELHAGAKSIKGTGSAKDGLRNRLHKAAQNREDMANTKMIGMQRAGKRIKEGVELDEISKALARKYVRIADDDNDPRDEKKYDKDGPEAVRSHERILAIAKKKIAGTAKVNATSGLKVVKEDEELDEISKGLGMRYMTASRKKIRDLHQTSRANYAKGDNGPEAEKTAHKLHRHELGYDMAANKLDGYAKVNVKGRKKAYQEEVELDEAGMPAGVIKAKQRYAEMTDADFAAAHGHKSDDELRGMAWRHGYGKGAGKGSDHYLNRVKKGRSVTEGKTLKSSEDDGYKNRKNLRDKVKKYAQDRREGKSKRQVAEMYPEVRSLNKRKKPSPTAAKLEPTGIM